MPDQPPREGDGFALPPGLTVVDVIADYLSLMRGRIEAQIAAKYGGVGLTLADVQWCLTVPAMWTDCAKGQMRQAVLKAGLIPDLHSDRLLLVAEPEAAAVYCRDKGGQYEMQEGETFMVVDAGGGTVDLTVHTLQDGLLAEVARGHGDTCGAAFVNDAFMQHVRHQLRDEDDYVDRTLAKHPSDAASLHKEWELKKYQVSADGEDAVSIALPTHIVREMPSEVMERLEDINEDADNHEDLFLSPEEQRSLFDPSLDGVLRLIEEQLDRVEGAQVDLMLLVGGFSGSPYLCSRVREAFGNRVSRIVSPPNPGSAVVHGATLYGLNPLVVAARRARYSYGIRQTVAYDDKNEAHVARRDCTRPCPNSLCDVFPNRFASFVRRGDSLPEDECVTKRYKPRSATQREVVLQLYYAESDDPFFVPMEGERGMDDQPVRPLGEPIAISLPHPSTTTADRTVEVSMYFGTSEIRVNIVPCCDTRKRVQRSIEFNLD
ncbi:heat shock protein 70 family protein [Kipferlia bialata]|uniref:Heat shock protein 70 family protein n=1 Tax=Kipferlia bialata TaxID=797122 RepID=A0A9K3CU77_9EUKA|nr:heat shock protein 70 family protein [Kipferlia bialata]|eukprot:g2676.t1